MQVQNIIDEDGVWITNSGVFAFTDPETNVRFEPGVRVKVKVSKWVESQPVLVKEEKPEPKEKK